MTMQLVKNVCRIPNEAFSFEKGAFMLRNDDSVLVSGERQTGD
jgi:hypothetical protein